jgi:hypothetical protein
MCCSSTIDFWLVFVLLLHVVTMDPDNCFTDAVEAPPLADLDDELECCLRRVSFCLPSYFHVIVVALIGCLFSQVLALSKSQREKRVAKSAQVAKSVELEALAHSQAEKFAKLEVACADLKREKENITASYR